ncbi:MAG: hypothetical protein ISS45_09915 [Candidatus Omnitrophica bacterium]|nr:hypothetical protein [Candidatus Omnitrophota bacterium]
MEKDLIYSYDKRRDVLYVSVGKPQEGIGDEIVDDVFVLLNPRTKKVVGFTIVNFQKKFIETKKNKHPSFRVPVKTEFVLS